MMRMPLVSMGPLLLVAHAALAAAGDTRLVASDDLLAVMQGPSARVFLADGRPLLRLPPVRDLPAASSAAPADESQDRREQIFELFDIPTELRDSQAAEDLVEEELTLRQQAAGPSAAVAGPGETDALAAADARGLWLVVSGDLYRAGPGVESARIGPVPHGLRALAAADDGTLVLGTATELLGSTDGGKTFRSLMRLARPPLQLAVDPSLRRLAWSDAAGMHLVRGGEDRTSREGRVRDLQVCGGQLVVLAEDGLHVSSARGALEHVCGRVPATRIACPRTGAGPWLLVGEGLAQSVDRGRSFRPRVDAPPGLIGGAAFTRERIWVVSPTAGLTSLSIPEGPAPERPTTPPSEEDAPARLPRWTSSLLPRLTLATSYARSASRRDYRALALAEVPLGRRERRLRADPAGGRMLAFADPEPPEPSPAQPPTPPYPGPATSPYPPRDPDAGCLALARAAAVARAQAEPERARSLVGRAGQAAWLPELRLRAEKRLGRSESLDVKPLAGSTAAGTERDALGLDVFDDVRYEVRATWDLPRLIFSPDEVAAAQQALRIADMRREIESQVNRIYFERRRLLVNPAGAPPAEATGALLRVEELEAELDALSAGAFSRCRGAGPPLTGP
jgi:hypothetical protein